MKFEGCWFCGSLINNRKPFGLWTDGQTDQMILPEADRYKTGCPQFFEVELGILSQKIKSENALNLLKASKILVEKSKNIYWNKNLLFLK